MDYLTLSITGVVAVVGAGVVGWGFMLDGSLGVLQEKIQRLWDAGVETRDWQEKKEEQFDVLKGALDNIMDSQKSMLGAMEEVHIEIQDVKKIADGAASGVAAHEDAIKSHSTQTTAQRKILDELLIALDAFSFAGARNSSQSVKYSTLRARVGELRKQLEAAQ